MHAMGPGMPPQVYHPRKTPNEQQRHHGRISSTTLVPIPRGAKNSIAKNKYPPSHRPAEKL